MGWSFTDGLSRSELIDEITRNETQADGTRWNCLRHCIRGNVLWTVWEVTPVRPDKSPFRFIGCHLLAYGGKGIGWGHKDMSESMGPCYYSCPLSYLDMVPEADAGWRDKVRAWHAARNRKVEVGDVLVFKGVSIPEARVVEKSGHRLIGEYAGRRYRLPPSVLARVIEQRR